VASNRCSTRQWLFSSVSPPLCRLSSWGDWQLPASRKGSVSHRMIIAGLLTFVPGPIMCRMFFG